MINKRKPNSVLPKPDSVLLAHFLARISARLLQFDAPSTPMAYTLAK